MYTNIAWNMLPGHEEQEPEEVYNELQHAKSLIEMRMAALEQPEIKGHSLLPEQFHTAVRHYWEEQGPAVGDVLFAMCEQYLSALIAGDIISSKLYTRIAVADFANTPKECIGHIELGLRDCFEMGYEEPADVVAAKQLVLEIKNDLQRSGITPIPLAKEKRWSFLELEKKLERLTREEK